MSTRPRPGLGGSIRKRLSGRKIKDKDDGQESTQESQNSNPADPLSPHRRSQSQKPNLEKSPGRSPGREGRPRSLSVDAHSDPDESSSSDKTNGETTTGSRRPNVFQRLRERSRSRSRSRSRTRQMDDKQEKRKEMLVAVTSCRSDGYYNQKAPGSTSKLPRKAPTNLKLFHELAVGVKDAYAAVGATPRKPSDEDKGKMEASEYDSHLVLWDFIGNLNFLLALVDEVSVDTVTRGALKEDSTFKGLRDVIKKGNRVLEEMLVRRERKYTLFFRLAQPYDVEQIDRIRAWNIKVEKAVGQVTDRPSNSGSESESDSDATSIGSSSTGSVSSRVGVFSRGRQLLPTAGRVRSRRATPTPRLRKYVGKDGSEGDAGADGFSAVTPPNELERQSSEDSDLLPSDLRGKNVPHLQEYKHVEPKDELVDVIRGLRVEKIKNSEGSPDAELAALKPNWRPKADIPSSVPKLPTEYVHRHRLMKQVVSCLLDEAEVPQNADGQSVNTAITCVTSRHGDKAGNGKSTLAVAVIQTVEVRERFSDGIAWLKLGPAPLSERDVRRLYEDLYRQLIVKEADMDASVTEEEGSQQFQESMASIRTDVSEGRIDRMVDRADSARRFSGGDLEGIKEDLARMIVKRNILICLDDVWRVEDAKWFIFESPTYSGPSRDSPYKILITTRMPGLLGNGAVQEVFVRIFSEHEAVKLLLSTAGRRPYGGRSSAVFNQSKMIVKGCGNSPLGILLIGSMLRQSSRNWNLNSPVWMGVYNQCSLNLEEAANMRSFKNAFTRIVDLSFFTIEDHHLRVALRRCFVLFSMAFRSNDWMLSGRGIPHSVLIKFFGIVNSAGLDGGKNIDPKQIVTILENLKLIQRARHSISRMTTTGGKGLQDSFVSITSEKNGNENSEKSDEDWDDFEDMPTRKIQHFYTMHDSLKAVAERMAERPLPAFSPEADTYTHFSESITQENKIVVSSKSTWVAPLRFCFPRDKNGSKQTHITDEYLHELVAIALMGGGDGKAFAKKNIKDAMRANQISMHLLDGGDKFEEYTTSFLCEHLLYANAHACAFELMTNPDFVRRRVFALGIMEATSRQVADIMDGRNFSAKGVNNKKLASARGEEKNESPERTTAATEAPADIDVDNIVCEASRIIIDEVYKVTNNMGSSDSLGMATCLVTVGETLLKCRQPRDAMLRLEEGVSIFRGLLGPYHVYVAHALHSVAKALSKLSEARVALLKFAEAARIYETCDATLHYDSIANAQALAALLVDIGDVRKAEAMFEEVIAMKQAVYGENSVAVAKTINSYAILLAKHGRMNDALRHYEIARATYVKAPPSLIVDPEFEAKCSYDMTLITLNIASIYSKKGDLKRALQCYEDGVKGLAEYEEAVDKIREIGGTSLASTKHSSHKHVIAALGRIGSIKVKLGDQEGALEAYLYLIDQVNEDSPLASHIEKAKAHIKCATLFRKRDTKEDHETSITHLKEALRMYKALYAPDHKDTLAISTTLKQWLSEDKTADKTALNGK